MLKNISQLIHTIENKVYHFTCDQDSPLPAVKEALFEFLKFVGRIEDQVKAAQEQAKIEKEAEDKAKLESNSAESKDIIEESQPEQVEA